MSLVIALNGKVDSVDVLEDNIVVGSMAKPIKTSPRSKSLACYTMITR